ncbi:AMFR [Symbiodinium necroappetens]|uniref:AMFR protein n=1 Tax=Symbiodinium necroappetens TaxID=1628268 RepID=A0A812U2B5_9DINO|nr:AMFR [Symbiodinium necroappetens]
MLQRSCSGSSAADLDAGLESLSQVVSGVLDDPCVSQMQLTRRQKLREFLVKHGFSHVSEPRLPAGCAFFSRESVYPIHVAARLCDDKIIRALLAEGADPMQRTSCGRTAEDFARKGKGDIAEVLALLQSHAGSKSASWVKRQT